MTTAASPFTLRPATQDDQQAIKTMIRAMRLNPIGLQWPHFLLAVDAEGQMIGCGQVKPHWDGSHELASIAVYKAWRRQGVARAIIEQLQADHAPPLWLTCPSRRIPIYQKFDFQEVTVWRQMPGYFRTVYALFKLFSPLMRLPAGNYLAVMVWHG